MLDPPLFRAVVSRLSPNLLPLVDAFAAPHNAQLPAYWSTDDCAFRHDWRGERPIWANPPFSLLPLVLAKLRHEGGHLLLLVSEWSAQLPALTALTQDSAVPGGRS